MPEELDARGWKCPLPVLRASKRLGDLPVGGILVVISTDPGSMPDFKAWAAVDPRVEVEKQEERQEGQGENGGGTVYVHTLRRRA